ncbi:Ribose import ATP-binding protein RbsA [Baekduia alba]|uniref:sugar ABC transporter ATP-binding protein n=1 Tax=Baekduia alba TaxID=2997333 RepID=UPI00234161FA|nr:sugar ABC transporter ATP-binding protein [Baekduia alba]WCB94864.1 Ribose import ATP-binding protein RbsA [Baekduia alba]
MSVHPGTVSAVAEPMTDASLLVARGISKAFPGVRALDGVDLTVGHREVHALLGENGAGKSTLMNVLAGVLRPDAGEIAVGGEVYEHLDAGGARRAGIGFVRQEPAVLTDLTVLENMTLGLERRRLRLVESRDRHSEAIACLQRVGLDVSPDLAAEQLTLAERQLLSIAKVLFERPRLLIMDEPTTSMTLTESDRLFRIIAEEVADGRSVIYISHRLEEVFRIADCATVLRNGERIGTVGIRDGSTSEDELIRMMIGKDLGEAFPERPPATPREGGHRLVIRGLLADVRPEDPDVTIEGGEVLGVAGLVGSGRTELVEALFGAAPVAGMVVELDGRPITPGSPRAGAAAGFALVPEDRRHQGFVGMMSVEENLTMSVPGRVSRLGVVRGGESRALTEDFCKRLAIKTYGPDQPVETLSGGNQQKVVIAKWMARRSTVFIFDEPTKGVDVGARGEIYREIAGLAAEGRIVLVVSSEMPEILGLSDQILVMRQGAPVALLSRADADAERVLRAAFGQEETT